MTVRMVPTARPQIKAAEARSLLAAHGVTDAVALLGVRSYYMDSMGEPGVGEVGVYDDAIVLVSTAAYRTFNANTDPSVLRPGVAVLKTGTWRYQRGLHGITRGNPYPALVQAAPVTVMRGARLDDTGFFGINIHRGGRTTTSSLGCQTIWPEQWDSFIALVIAEMVRCEQHTVPYCLITEEERRAS